MKNVVFIILCLSIIVSCTKEKNELLQINTSTGGYYPMSCGNYWIYELYDVDSSGNEYGHINKDSIIITKEIEINGNNYFVFEGTKYPYIFNWSIIDVLRDSFGYLVDTLGRIKFAENNFHDTLLAYNHGTFSYSFKMQKHANPVVVPAGTFNILNYETTLTVFIPILPGVDNPRYEHKYYANGVGMISESFLPISYPGYKGKRLLRYYVK